ncbi:MAG: membrane protease YdiL (CAAX protease family), partial [Pirellulaceae bacterium]
GRLPARLAMLPILGSSAIFALMHFSHGPDPIPLFFLSIGIGYVYQRTHRILPCILIHMLLNGFSILLLWLQLFGGK